MSVGVDPGKSGAIAIVDRKGVFVEAIKLSVTPIELSQFVDTLRYCDAFAVVEKVHSSPQMGVKSSFSFGQYYERPRQTLVCYGIPFEEVRPQKWQREMGCLSKGNKNVTKARAQELFPSVKVCHWIADALLLAEYARRVRCLTTIP